ncbi:MAG: hypothetical protein ACP5NC_04530 [Nitrososphaeria archaeon]
MKKFEVKALKNHHSTYILERLIRVFLSRQNGSLTVLRYHSMQITGPRA